MRIAEIVVIHHRTPDTLARSLGLLARFASEIPVRVFDAAPLPDAAEHISRAHPGATLEPISNHSYAAAVNHALRTARGELVLIMNADVSIGDDTVRALAAPFRDPRVALTGPLAFTPLGRVQDQGLPYRFATRRIRGLGPEAVCEVPWLAAFLFVARVTAARSSGGMDASLRFYNEDLEWCFRLRRDGWRCMLVGADVVHLGGDATPDSGRFLVEGLRGGMIVADRYRGPIRRELQRVALYVVAVALARFGPSDRRTAWAAVARMLLAGRYDVSPFGTTLADPAVGFPDRWPAPRTESGGDP